MGRGFAGAARAGVPDAGAATGATDGAITEGAIRAFGARGDRFGWWCTTARTALDPEATALNPDENVEALGGDGVAIRDGIRSGSDRAVLPMIADA